MSKTKLPTVKAIMDENNCTAEAAESIRARLEVEADRAYRRKTGRHFLTVVKAHDLERHPELAVQDTIRPKLTEWNIQDHLKTAEDRAAYIFATVEEVGTPDALRCNAPRSRGRVGNRFRKQERNERAWTRNRY